MDKEAKRCCVQGLRVTCLSCQDTLTVWDGPLPTDQPTLMCKCRFRGVGFAFLTPTKEQEDPKQDAEKDNDEHNHNAWDSTLLCHDPEQATVTVLRQCSAEDEDTKRHHHMSLELTWNEWESLRNDMREADLRKSIRTKRNDKPKPKSSFLLTEEDLAQEVQASAHARTLASILKSHNDDGTDDDDERVDDADNPTPFWEDARESAAAAQDSEDNDEDEDDDDDK